MRWTTAAILALGAATAAAQAPTLEGEDERGERSAGTRSGPDAEEPDAEEPDAEGPSGSAAPESRDELSRDTGSNDGAWSHEVGSDESDEPEPPVFGAAAEVSLPPEPEEVRSISQTRVDEAVVRGVPRRNAGDILRSAPGFHVSQGEGEGVGHHILVRGFDAEHGQDLAVSVDGVPMNQPSAHVHGPGYVDLGWVVPEAVRSLRVTEGVYDPAQGDFAIAGSVDYELGAPREGWTFVSEVGSFGTVREAAVFGAHDRDTFGAAQVRRTAGYGQRRGGAEGGGLMQIGFGGRWRQRLWAGARAARYESPGMVRRDDVAAGSVGFYDAYSGARDQRADAVRGLVGWSAERRGAGGRRTRLGLWAGFDHFRLRQNLTGFTVRQETPGDLSEQLNRTSSVGVQLRHRGRRIALGDFGVRLRAGMSGRFDEVRASQDLVAAPRPSGWSGGVDARTRGADLGLWLDTEVEAGAWGVLRAGVRGELLAYDVRQPLGDDPSFVTGRVMPRASVELRPTEQWSLLMAYGEGFRSPLARGARRPTQVRSADLGVRVHLGDILDARLGGFWVRRSDDLTFHAHEGRLESAGPTARLGAQASVRGKPWPWLVFSGSVTYVDIRRLEGMGHDGDGDPHADEHAHGDFGIPPWVARLDLTARKLLSMQRDVVLRAGIGASGLSSRDLGDGLRSQAIGLLDARVGLRWGLVALDFEVLNLTDQRYGALELLYESRWLGSEPTEARHVAAAAPRSFMVRLTVEP